MVRQGGKEARPSQQPPHPKDAARLTLLRKGEEITHHSWGQRTFQDRQHVTERAQEGGQVGSPRIECSVPGSTATPSHPPRSRQPSSAVPGHSGEEKPPPAGCRARSPQGKRETHRKPSAAHRTLPFPPKEEKCSWKQRERKSLARTLRATSNPQQSPAWAQQINCP